LSQLIGFCIDSDRIINNIGKCRKPIWTHYSKLPDWCSHGYIYEASNNTIRISHPLYYNESTYRFCISVGEKVLETYSSIKTSKLLKNISEVIITYPGKLGIDTVLSILYRELITYYHRELSVLDSEIEENIDMIMKGYSRYKQILSLYRRASRLHKGVHGVIYSLRRLENKYSFLGELVNEAIMLENMYSTSIDRITQAISLYYTFISEKTNRIVTKLTIISAIFLPLTLIAGIYGMNFKYMPELNHPLAYPLTLLAMALIAIGELIYFKKKKWI
jgi:magnesium transporter